VRLQIDLLDATSGAELWGDHYDRKLADLLAVQDQISREVSQRLRATLGEGGRPAKRCIVSASHRSGGKLAAHALWYCALSRGHRNFTSFSQRHAAT
jgi:hypothetical protein